MATNPKLVGRCPSNGHPIYQAEDGTLSYSCEDSGRGDGLFASAGTIVKLTPSGPLGSTVTIDKDEPSGVSKEHSE